MSRTRSIFLHGLGITLRRLPAFLWTYAFSLVLAFAFCYPMKMQLANLLDRSLAAQRLSSGFDIGTAVDAALRLHEGTAGQSSTLTSHGSIPAYLLVYFLLVPGTLFCYITRSHARLSTLIREGIVYFWRFVRITVLSLIAAALVLGPLAALQGQWSRFIDERFVGRGSLVLRLCGLLVILLVASLLRLYFDLVEAYTVQLGSEPRPNGKQDRRVRRTLGPAFRLLRHHLLRAWFVFLLLAAIGAAGAFATGRIAMHMLAQPRVWPMFLVAQCGILLMLFTRFWQRGAEASLVLQHPLLPVHEGSSVPFVPKAVPPPVVSDRPQHVEMIYNPDPLTPLYPAPLSTDDLLARSVLADPPATEPDPIPDPEPAAPSLDEPDPGVFHHEPRKPER
jgi:hypothetical protein